MYTISGMQIMRKQMPSKGLQGEKSSTPPPLSCSNIPVHTGTYDIEFPEIKIVEVNWNGSTYNRDAIGFDWNGSTYNRDAIGFEWYQEKYWYILT